MLIETERTEKQQNLIAMLPKINCHNCQGIGCPVCCWNGWIPDCSKQQEYLIEESEEIEFIPKIKRKYVKREKKQKKEKFNVELYHNAIRNMYLNGARIIDLCKLFKTSTKIIGQILSDLTKHTRAIEKDKVKLIVEDYYRFMTYDKICEKHNISHTTILNILKNNKLPQRTSKKPIDEIEVLRQYEQEGKSIKEIKKKFHVDTDRIRKIVEKSELYIARAKKYIHAKR